MVENEIISSRYKSFEDIKHFDENNNEYWLARVLQITLQYTKGEFS